MFPAESVVDAGATVAAPAAPALSSATTRTPTAPAAIAFAVVTVRDDAETLFPPVPFAVAVATTGDRG